MRHLTSDTERIRAAGYTPQVDLADGIGRYLDWIRSQADVRDYFSEAADILRSKGIVHSVGTAHRIATQHDKQLRRAGSQGNGCNQ